MQLVFGCCLGLDVFGMGITVEHLKDMLEDTAELISTVSKCMPTNVVWIRGLPNIDPFQKISNMILLNDNVTIRGKRCSKEGNVMRKVMAFQSESKNY